jgi:hypothetical protein
MANAVCDPGAAFRHPWPTSEKLNATFFAGATPRCKHFGERTPGIRRRVDVRRKELPGENYGRSLLVIREKMEERGQNY